MDQRPVIAESLPKIRSCFGSTISSREWALPQEPGSICTNMTSLPFYRVEKLGLPYYYILTRARTLIHKKVGHLLLPSIAPLQYLMDHRTAGLKFYRGRKNNLF
jgi:hypothetical protein